VPIAHVRLSVDDLDASRALYLRPRSG
jgi:hypothetical protein